MRVLFGIVLAVILGALGLAGWVYSGQFDVSARESASPALDWLMDTAKRQSVRARAHDIQVPPLGDSILVEEGAQHYRDACAQCHGAPGKRSEPFARAMRPEPPDLVQAVRGWTSAQLFWIIQNGIKMTGMPAWQGRHVDGEIWALVAFLDQLPHMDAARYQALTAPPTPPEPETPPPPEQEMIPPSEGEEPAPAPMPPEGPPPPPQ